MVGIVLFSRRILVIINSKLYICLFFQCTIKKKYIYLNLCIWAIYVICFMFFPAIGDGWHITLHSDRGWFHWTCTRQWLMNCQGGWVNQFNIGCAWRVLLWGTSAFDILTYLKAPFRGGDMTHTKHGNITNLYTPGIYTEEPENDGVWKMIVLFQGAPYSQVSSRSSFGVYHTFLQLVASDDVVVWGTAQWFRWHLGWHFPSQQRKGVPMVL